MPQSERNMGGNVIPAGYWLAGCVAYVTVVLGADALATLNVDWPWHWGALRWRSLGLFDGFKFLFWLVVPFAVSVRGMDWGAFGFRGWRWRDVWLLGGLALAGLCAVLLIPLVPALREVYPGFGDRSAAVRWAVGLRYSIWLVSWLPGWEFLHRYVLLRAADRRWARYGWLLVPLSEGLYHLQKPFLEMAGMVVFSVVLCQWSLRRKNVLLPFLAHLTVELELILFLAAW